MVATTNGSQQQTGDMRYNAFGQESAYINATTTFGWNGKSQYQTDVESGLMLLGHRYYDPSTGRFISQDPAQDESNWYAYCGNNPLTGVDPTGLVSQAARPLADALAQDTFEGMEWFQSLFGSLSGSRDQKLDVAVDAGILAGQGGPPTMLCMRVATFVSSALTLAGESNKVVGFEKKDGITYEAGLFSKSKQIATPQGPDGSGGRHTVVVDSKGLVRTAETSGQRVTMEQYLGRTGMTRENIRYEGSLRGAVRTNRKSDGPWAWPLSHYP